MTFWLTLLGYQATWFAAVIGAGQGLWWPGAAAAGLFALWRLSVSPHRLLEARLVLVALAVGLVLENLWVRSGLLDYAAAWPWAGSPSRTPRVPPTRAAMPSLPSPATASRSRPSTSMP